MENHQDIVSFIWDIADLLRDTYKRNEYQKVILPFTVLKRFDCVLEHSKDDVLRKYNEYKDKIENLDPILEAAAVDKDGRKLGFYNYSKYDFKSLLEDPDHIEENLMHYLDCFSPNVKDIFENFYIKTHIEKLSKANLLYLLIKKFSESKVDLHPDKISNHDMGIIFEELIRRFSEQSNEEAGQHFTPRDVVKLMTHLLFLENGENLKEKNLIKKIYDPACGTGGMLTSCKNFVREINDTIDVVLYGQEINEEIYAICKADMLIKGERAENIKGPSSTLSDDQLKDEKFDFMISNPPYGRKWEQDKEVVEKEAELGFDGRFGAGLPGIKDGQLLFIQHMLSKMKDDEKSRIAVITNGSPLFTGDAGSGESNIRRWIIENDYLETIIGLPDQLFYNTSIRTYIWILTNQKSPDRIGKIQLIDASSKYVKMRKSLGKKRHQLSDRDIDDILTFYRNFSENDMVKIFDNDDFGYVKVTVERPMQLNFEVTEERLQNLYSMNAFRKLAESKNKNIEKRMIEEEKGKKLQLDIIRALQKINGHYKNWKDFEKEVKRTLKNFELSNAFIRNIIHALSEHDETADYVTDTRGNIKPDPKLRDTERIPLKEDIDEYFKREVLPYYPDAWMDRKKDKIGYEINFNQYFYKYKPPRSLEDINSDIQKLTSEILELIKDDLDD
ncbi:SAM-dependent DNA methyltransferase [Methanothermobacter marburgensis]|uniref:site-specific DNA-methyltransferase (adenine-specific) n=1 Tax=Methanothermobacter marburgensis (strain ATCC BAA-927 / DSM 2133 / JCM 14651 / NBRC 100331 / OCM 82 / Marburg) TaxID=79929 RepID=D9PXV3_METTM|nr:class I SAM-dependent DNA methyltransferase [Methanothermobacter marburgensis]ADL59051.1 predicted type I restriction-modification enzyme, subunit M [Methanothermobacter marburgensis str. Marburg]WBF09578.1 SAM-dependent DNA methyltransferase [Methanothermobacter marburgensis]